MMINNRLKCVGTALIMLVLAACGEKPAATERTEEKPAQLDAATQVGVSTNGQAGTMLNAPGNYVRGMVGNIDAAKKAAALAGKTAEEHLNMDPSKDDNGQ